jgi:3-phosphoshikimate 1-carboxyvinyltransferase
MRLLMGVLAGQPFLATLTGDRSLSSRPMRRVADPLRQMGAKIEGKDGGNFAPLTIQGGKLKAIDANLPVASAQVKSAILLAGLYADGETRVTEPEKSRDHTERFLKSFGVTVNEEALTVSVQAGKALKAKGFAIAGDISSAAFFMAAALLAPESTVEFESVLNNSTRTGIIQILKRMGVPFVSDSDAPGGMTGGPEPTAHFVLTSHQLKLKAFEIEKRELASLIDEIPILCVLATQAQGITTIHDADELRVKETDRIHSMVSQLTQMGATIKAEGNSIFIEGPTKLRGAVVNSFKDHRTAMSLIIAGLIAKGETVVEDIDCIDTSFPGFFEFLKNIGGQYQMLAK